MFYVSFQLGIIIPTDSYFFQNGRYTTNQFHVGRIFPYKSSRYNTTINHRIIWSKGINHMIGIYRSLVRIFSFFLLIYRSLVQDVGSYPLVNSVDVVVNG